MEVAFVVDTTSSMVNYFRDIHQKINSICERLMKDIPNIKIALLAVEDYEAEDKKYVVSYVELSDDVDEIMDWINTAGCDESVDGRDFPEAYELALHKVRRLSWTSDPKVKKLIVFIGDAIPHAPSYIKPSIYWRDEVNLITQLGIKIYGVQANSHDVSKVFFEEMSQMTGGTYISLGNSHQLTSLTLLAVCYHEHGRREYLKKLEEETKKAITGNKLSDILSTLIAGPSHELEQIGTRFQYPWYNKEYDLVKTPSFSYNTSNEQWEIEVVKKANPKVATQQARLAEQRAREERREELKRQHKEEKLRLKAARKRERRQEERKRKREEEGGEGGTQEENGEVNVDEESEKEDKEKEKEKDEDKEKEEKEEEKEKEGNETDNNNQITNRNAILAFHERRINKDKIFRR